MGKNNRKKKSQAPAPVSSSDGDALRVRQNDESFARVVRTAVVRLHPCPHSAHHDQQGPNVTSTTTIVAPANMNPSSQSLVEQGLPQPKVFPANENDLTHLQSLSVDPSSHTSSRGAPDISTEMNLDDEEPCDHEHFSNRAPWLRAMVLGANDGLVSVAALMMGVAGGNADLAVLRLTGVAGLIAGALSMAVGEFVSVSSQRDAEHADIKKEIEEQLKGPEAQARELEELAQIYVSRGVPYHLAFQVAHHLTETDVIRAHARDELGIDLDDLANPWQAAGVSFLCFGIGATVPLLAGAFLAEQWARITSILLATTAGLVMFGVLGAYFGGANVLKGALRVVIGGWLALGISYGIGAAFDVAPA